MTRRDLAVTRWSRST